MRRFTLRKFLLSLLIVMSFVYSQTPIIRLMQSREYKTPKFWWRDQVTHSLRTYLADVTATPAYTNNNKGLTNKAPAPYETRYISRCVLCPTDGSIGFALRSQRFVAQLKTRFAKPAFSVHIIVECFVEVLAFEVGP